jgi:hypothetical protein
VLGFAAVGALVVVLAAVDVRFFGEPLREWFRPQAIVTFTGVVAGFLVLRWQLATQHRNATRANAEKDRNQLHLEIYRDVAEQNEKASRALHALGAEVGLRANMAASLASLPTPPAFPEPGAALELQSAATAEVIALMGALEKWEIAIGPGVANFKGALRDGLDQLRKDFDRVHRVLLAVAYAKPAVGAADLVEGKAAGDGLQNAAMTIASYIWDLRIALQNELLGGLFDYHVPERQPGDLQYKAVTLEGSWAPPTRSSSRSGVRM